MLHSWEPATISFSLTPTITKLAPNRVFKPNYSIVYIPKYDNSRSILILVAKSQEILKLQFNITVAE
jgi:hypothetical protein